MPRPIHRRTLLRAAGVALALPSLESMYRGYAFSQTAESSNLTSSNSPTGNSPKPPQRLVTICTSLGIHAPFLFPQSSTSQASTSEPSTSDSSTPYLDVLKEHRQQMTLFSGLSHPDQAGADGHTSEQTWLTAARHPGLGAFRNSISLDQWIAESTGVQTRFPSLVLGTGHSSQSYTRSGVMIPAEDRPSRVFAKLFLDGNPDEVASQLRKLREGRSIMDTVGEQAKRLERRVGPQDRDKLQEYFQSVRDMEVRLAQSEAWSQKPKPKIEAEAPKDISDEKDLIGRMNLLLDLIPLALQTDSTRLITVFVQGRNDVPPVPGVNIDHHNLSHHGQDETKIQQLKLIELAQFQALNRLLSQLRTKTEEDKPLLDSTMVLYGSNLGNANSHDTRNLPVLLAGGKFRHGRYHAYDSKNNVPLCNLFVQMLQQMGMETDRFGSSTSSSLPDFLPS